MTELVRSAGRADVNDVAHTLGRAFFEDPVMSWILPEAHRRIAAARRFFAAVTRHHFLPAGVCDITGDGIEIAAAALWAPPGHWRLSPRENLRILPSLLLTFRSASGRGRALDELMQQHHPEEPHWYLSTIGSDPTFRGQGYGRALLTSRLEQIDAEHAPTYLESSKAENVPYYQRFGFEVTGEIVVPDGGPTLWSMWRAPR